MGRKPIDQTAMTSAQRQRRYRDKRKNAGEVARLPSAGAAIIQERFRRATAHRPKSNLDIPSIDWCDWIYKTVMPYRMIILDYKSKDNIFYGSRVPACGGIANPVRPWHSEGGTAPCP
jgi:hypothetical protein